jgi:hypothetical protein
MIRGPAVYETAALPLSYIGEETGHVLDEPGGDGKPRGVPPLPPDHAAGGGAAPAWPHPSATSTPRSLRLSAPTSPPSSQPNCASSSSREIASRKSPRPSDSLAKPASPRSASVRVDPIGTPAAASVDPLPFAEIAYGSDALRNRCSTTELHRRGNGVVLDEPRGDGKPPGAPPARRPPGSAGALAGLGRGGAGPGDHVHR